MTERCRSHLVSPVGEEDVYHGWQQRGLCHMAGSGILVLMLGELAGYLQDPGWPVLSRDVGP